MAEFEPAIQHTLQEEGGFFQNPVTGEVCNFGITHWTLRALGYLAQQPTREATPDEVAFVKGITPTWAAGFYLKHYWPGIECLRDQNLANKVFDLSVNLGKGTAVELLQKAINALGNAGLTVDGQIGPKTCAAANQQSPAALLAFYRDEAAKYYREVAAANPQLACDLNGWLKRLAA
jgi:lysozyme family protein